MAIIKKDSITNEQKIQDLLAYTQPDGECMLWRGARATDGYPVMAKNKKVSRLMTSLKYNIDITGQVVRHRCDNPLCINPEHLLLGTPADNVKDRDERGRTYKKITKEIVFRVKELFASKLLSNKEIANILNIDSRRVSDILTGKYNDEGKLTRYINKE